MKVPIMMRQKWHNFIEIENMEDQFLVLSEMASTTTIYLWQKLS